MVKTNVDPNEPSWVRFVAGGAASCTAEIATLPIDTVKVRMQIAPKGEYSGVLDCFRKTIRAEGMGGLYKGLSPALVRQMSYSGIRIGIYEPIRNWLTNDGESSSFLTKLAAGGLSGGLAISIANPSDLIKTRMQADKTGTRYNGIADAFGKIMKQEGVLGLWTGVGPAIQRAVVVNAAELASYDHAKDLLVDSPLNMDPDWISTQAIASCIAGLFTAACCSPIDVIKNRLMSQTAGSTQLYSGAIDCAIKTVRAEGPLALYNGFLPLYLRLGPWCTVMFVSYEQYRSWAKLTWEDKK